MSQTPKPKRGLPRALLYGLIPGGFIVMVLFFLLSGWAAEEEPAEMTEARERAEEISEAEAE